MDDDKIISTIFIPERRIVLFEKAMPATKIRSMFLELWDSCTLRGVGGESAATDFYLTKNDDLCFELNRVSKILFIADYHFFKIFFEVFGEKKIENEVHLKILCSTISNIIKKDLGIDPNYNYCIKNYFSYSPTFVFVINTSIEVDIEQLRKPVKDIDDM